MRRLRGLQVVGLAAGEAAADGAEHFFRVRVGGVSGYASAPRALNRGWESSQNAPLSARGFFARSNRSNKQLSEELDAKPLRRRRVQTQKP